MKAEQRRIEILLRLQSTETPISASKLAEELGVSRQVIVGDIALLRAKGEPIEALARGYVLAKKTRAERIFKVHHSDDDTQTELELIVDIGGTVLDVFIYHKAYGTVRAPMNISNRMQIKKFISDVTSGKSSLLKNVTSNYHYHTVSADSTETLDMIENALREHNFLAPLQEHEPHGVH